MNAKPSVCGPLSIGCGLAGFCLVVVMQWLPGSMAQRWGVTMMILIALMIFLLCGIGIGIAGMVREERLRWLPAFGFGFNLVLLISGFSIQ